MTPTDLNLLAVISYAFGPVAMPVLVTVFALGVIVLGAVLRVVRAVLHQPERPLTWGFLARTFGVLAVTAGVWAVAVTLGQSVPPVVVGVALFMLALCWLWMMVFCLKLIALMRRVALLGALPEAGQVAVPERPDAGPIRTVPTLSQWLLRAFASWRVLQWVPLLGGLVVMTVSAGLFRLIDPAGGVTLSPAGFPDIVPVVEEVRMIVFVSVAVGVVLLLLVARFAARRGAALPDDPWARLERLAAAERARR